MIIICVYNQLVNINNLLSSILGILDIKRNRPCKRPQIMKFSPDPCQIPDNRKVTITTSTYLKPVS